jgi:hypothetical protein
VSGAAAWWVTSGVAEQRHGLADQQLFPGNGLLARLRTLDVEDEIGTWRGVDHVVEVDGEVDADHVCFVEGVGHGTPAQVSGHG